MAIEFPTVATGNAGRVFFAWTESSGERGTVMLVRARTRERD